jgi:hypothetical protein
MAFAEVTDREPGDIDWELVARLNLYEFLHEIHLANVFASMPNGQDALAAFGADLVDRMVHRSRVAANLSDEQRAEWAVNAKTVTERLLMRAEARRKDLQQTLARGG